MMKRSSFIAVLLLLTLAAFASACPMCRDSVPTDSTGASTAGVIPFNLGIYYMLGGFFLVVGMVSTILWRGVRDAAR